MADDDSDLADLERRTEELGSQIEDAKRQDVGEEPTGQEPPAEATGN